MQAKKPTIDIVNTVLEDCIMAYPVSSFVISLYKQYQQRGSLSKKQLIGLHAKASAIENMLPGKLATLQALINKMPNRFKSELPETVVEEVKDDKALLIINAILEKYPHHKRVLFLRSKFDNNEVITPGELADLIKLKAALKLT